VNNRARASRRLSKEGSSERRREAVFVGLHECILEKGYARTTLADIARAAHMSPSHLLYYFSEKTDILSQYFGNVAGRITNRLEEARSEEPLHRIDLLARLFFGGKGLSKSEIGFMLECFGVAVHDPSLKQQKSDLDRLCKQYLQDLFADCGGSSADCVYCAEVAYAILVGLRTAVYFDERLSVKEAHEIFRSEVLRMAKPKLEGRHPKDVRRPAKHG
jgi:AcrR family transcriptional regulator